MIKPSKSPKTLNRSFASNRWSPEEDNRLLELVQQQLEWTDIANAMNRTFAGVQHRFRFLKSTLPGASAIVAKNSTRAQDAKSAPDLSCGAISKAGRRVVEAVKSEVSEFYGREIIVSGFLTDTDLIIGALVRELLLQRYRDVSGWLRITVSRITSSEHGIGIDRFCRVLDELEKSGLLERFVGYRGALALPRKVARQGRFVQVRASMRLIKICRDQRITASNLFTHFPSLSG
jgi:hypothetical protein